MLQFIHGFGMQKLCYVNSDCYQPYLHKSFISHEGPDLLSCDFYSTYQIFFTLSDTGIRFTRVNEINSDTF